MKVGCGKRNLPINLYNFLNFYLKQSRNNCCLKEILMEMSRYMFYVYCYICIWFSPIWNCCSNCFYVIPVFYNQVAKIETEKMLIQMVETELAKRKQEGTYKGEFKGQSHFFGYLYSFPEKMLPFRVTELSIIFMPWWWVCMLMYMIWALGLGLPLIKPYGPDSYSNLTFIVSPHFVEQLILRNFFQD